MTVLVVESEYADYERLRGLVDWEKYGITQLEYCGDGASALEMILREWPDAVFTDISLPGMDGIELLRRCREHGISCEFVITSKWRRFEYAQSVMRFGVEEYLVKPVDRAELERVVLKLIERQRARSARDMTEHLLKTRILLRNSFMEIFTSGNPAVSYTLEELNEKYHFNLTKGVFRTAVVTLSGLPASEAGFFLPTLAQNMRAAFDPVCYEMIPYIRRNERLTLTFNYGEGGDAETLFPAIQEMVSGHIAKRRCDKASYSIGLGAPVHDISELGRTLDTAERAARCGILRGRNQLFDYASIRFDEVKTADVLTPALTAELKKSAELLLAEDFDRAVRAAFAGITFSTDPGVLIDVCEAASEIILTACEKAGYGSVTRESRRALLERLGAETTLTGTISDLTSWASTQFEACQAERRNSRPVRDAMRYIQAHYMEPLTLEHIADIVHLNASYFSIIFKKQTGQNFSDYLTNCRIEAAKRLLQEGDMSVARIGEEVGYLDRKYFSRTFAKLVGVRPSAYRMLHG